MIIRQKKKPRMIEKRGKNQKWKVKYILRESLDRLSGYMYYWENSSMKHMIHDQMR